MSTSFLFCLHKDPTDASKLRPLGIPTAMRRIIARHVAQHFKPKFAEFLLPFNFAVGIPQGSATVINAIQLGIEKYISNNEQQGLPPTRAAVFFDLSNMFNNISRVEFLDIISASFPELIPLIQLFYDSPGAVHYKINIVKWATLFMEEGSTQGCPLSPILASLVVVRLLQPINNALRQRAAERLANGITHDDGRGGITNLLGFIDDISTVVPLEDLSWECRRHVADMSARHSDVGGLRQKRHVAATQDMKKKPRHTQFMSITADKFKSAQTYKLATLP
jgi:hypothetical protein